MFLSLHKCILIAIHIIELHRLLSLQSEAQLLGTLLILLGTDFGSGGVNVKNDTFVIMVHFLFYRDSSVSIVMRYWLDDRDSFSDTG